MAFEKVSPKHPDKKCDRIGGAIVDLAYTYDENPTVAGEILMGHGRCHIIIESNIARELQNDADKIGTIVDRIAEEPQLLDLVIVPQDKHLNNNQKGKTRCGDNGLFHAFPMTYEQKELAKIAQEIYEKYPYDGKYILDKEKNKLVICQSNVKTEELKAEYPYAIVNPLGDWTGGLSVDTGACNRKLGCDLAQSNTGGGIHFKDLSKADVSLTIFLFLTAQDEGLPVELTCAIGDEQLRYTFSDGRNYGLPYSLAVTSARTYINDIGGFEKLAEWGLVR